MFNQFIITHFVREKDYQYRLQLAGELFVQRLINFGSALSLGRRFSENEALDSLHLISEPELSGLPEYWISLHTYSCLLLEKKGWDKSLIIREYLKNFNRFRLKKGLVPSEIIFNEEPKQISEFIIETVRQSDIIWNTEYFSDEMYRFLFELAYSSITKRIKL